MSATAQVWAALGAEAQAHGFPGVESYCAAYAAGFRPAEGSAGAEHAEAFYRAADAAGLPLEAFVVRSSPEAGTGVAADGTEGPDEEPWLGDEDHRGLRPVSESRSLTIAADSRPAPVPTVRPEVTLAQTAATVAVVEMNDGSAADDGGAHDPHDDGSSGHAAADAESAGDDHAFGTGSPDHDPAADPAFGEGHPLTPAEIDAHDPAVGVIDPADPAHLPPDPATDPGGGLAGPDHDLLAPDHDLVPPDAVEPAHDLPDHHGDPAYEPEPAHGDVPAVHDGGGESFG